jgi:hypothetical protein
LVVDGDGAVDSSTFKEKKEERVCGGKGVELRGRGFRY